MLLHITTLLLKECCKNYNADLIQALHELIDKHDMIIKNARDAEDAKDTENAA